MAGEGVIEVSARTGEHEAPGEKGLKASALGFMSSVVIGVASTAPGYSLAATLGFVTAVAGIGYQAPIVMVIAFIPMLLIALAFKYLNEADPDCGTTFSWGTRAFGPVTGWLGGWGIIYADVLVMASLSQIAGSYTFLLFGQDDLAANRFWVGVIGVIWILADEPDLLRRRRGFRENAVVPARSGDRRAGDLLDRRARPRLHPGSGRERPPVAELAEPARHQLVRRADRAGCCWRSSSTGGGTPPSPSTRRRRTRRRRPGRRPSSARCSCSAST